MTGPRPPVGQCKACRESIIWCVTPAGKRMPVDVEPTEGGNLTLSGHRPVPVASVVSKGGRYPGLKLHTSHFASCSRVRAFRRKQDRQRERQQTTPADQGALFGGGGR